MQYDEGKIYMRDKRNGNIHLYERHLAANKNFEPCVPNPIKKPVEKPELEVEKGSK